MQDGLWQGFVTSAAWLEVRGICSRCGHAAGAEPREGRRSLRVSSAVGAEWAKRGVREQWAIGPLDLRGLSCWVVTLHRCILTHLRNSTSQNLIKIN